MRRKSGHCGLCAFACDRNREVLSLPHRRRDGEDEAEIACLLRFACKKGICYTAAI